MISKVDIYYKPNCPFCITALQLLRNKSNIELNEIDISTQPHLTTEMIKRANNKYTVPQIFINNNHIGGCDELIFLEQKGQLDTHLYNQQ